MSTNQSDTAAAAAVISQLTNANGQVQQYVTQPITIEYKTPQQSLEDALNFNERQQPQAVVSTETRVNPLSTESTTNTLTRRPNAITNNDFVTAATVGAGLAASNASIATNSTCKMRDFVNTMMRKMNDTKYLYPSMAVLIMAIIVIIVLFQKISIIVKIICVVLLIVFMAATIVQFRQF